MRVSLILPTLNAGPCLEHLLSKISAQDTGVSEIIIIDSSSEDNTVAIARHYGAETIVIPRNAFNHGTTRNVASQRARGDVLMFMTQDAVPADTALVHTLTAPLKDPSIAATYGRHVPRSDASLLEICARRFNYPETPKVKTMRDLSCLGIKTFFFSNVCSAVKKELFFSCGMFPEVKANEDMILAARLILEGYAVAYVPEARVIHSHNYSLAQQFKRYYRIGSSLRHHPWILTHTHSEGEGMQLTKKQVRSILSEHRYPLLLQLVMESVLKYAGYRFGLITG